VFVVWLGLASKEAKKMSTKRDIAVEPWHAAKELELLERPGIQTVSLLTDECGCLLLAQGILPEYLRRQAEDALRWLATDDRGLARRALDSERRRAMDATTDDKRGKAMTG